MTKIKVRKYILEVKEEWSGDVSTKLYLNGEQVFAPLELRSPSAEAAVQDLLSEIENGWEPVIEEKIENACPDCGQKTFPITVGKRYAYNHRTFNRCECGWNDDDGVDQATITTALEEAGAIKRDMYSHRDGRVGVKEVSQFNEDGYDPRFD